MILLLDVCAFQYFIHCYLLHELLLLLANTVDELVVRCKKKKLRSICLYFSLARKQQLSVFMWIDLCTKRTSSLEIQTESIVSAK